MREDGRVAQLVERGIENPCVGGSNPSLATPSHRQWFLFAGALLAFSACGDRCDVLCADVSRALATCKGDEVAWVDLGARSRADYAARCRDEWESLRADLDGWEIEVGLNECGDGQEVLADMTCEQVAELYIPE